MEWKDWVGKKVFIKLIDGSIFSESLITDFADGFLSLTDKFGTSVQVNISQISKIVEEDSSIKMKGGNE